MAYFIFKNNCDNLEGTLYKIAENQNDLNNLNIILSDYKIIEDSQSNFDAVKLCNQSIIKYNNNIITYLDNIVIFDNSEILKQYINNFDIILKKFLNNNPNHPQFNKWNNYSNQLSSLNLGLINYPLNKSLEQYFEEQGQPSLNPLQLP